MLSPQSLNDVDLESRTELLLKEAGATGYAENSRNDSLEVGLETSIFIKETKGNSKNEYFKLKSKSGLFSVFNEIIYYWFHQL